MTGGGTKSYSLFTGCLIPSKFPFIEIASRKVLEALGIELVEIEGASCCPNQMAIQSSDKDLWYAVAARNLCLAERNGHDILTLCNGCYDTLKSVNSKLKGDGELRARMNGLLSEHGLEFKGLVDVKHIVQVLHDDVGLNAIDRAAQVPLGRFRFAPFVGCHVKRPLDHMGFDDPEEPYYLMDLIRAAGGRTVDYPEEHTCCAGGFSIARKDDVVPSVRRIVRSALDAGADALVVNCPYCFAQFFANEGRVSEDYAERISLPIFYFTQLIGLAMGMDSEELAMPMHYERSTSNEHELVSRILGKDMDEPFFNEEVTRSQLEMCRECLACVDDCQTAMTVSEYRPEELLELVLEGRIDEAVERPDIWYCINCHECVERCPQHFGMVSLLVRLKNLAVERGIYPDAVGHRQEGLNETGYAFAPDAEVRERLGLEAVRGPEIEKFKRFLEEASRECR